MVLSDLPAYSGISNTNYQIVSTRAGVEAARASGKAYVLKTRTDQRFYAPSSLEFLHHLIRKFPVTGNWAQKSRIVGHSLGAMLAIDMLVRQAEIAFERWTGIAGSASVMRSSLEAWMADTPEASERA